MCWNGSGAVSFDPVSTVKGSCASWEIKCAPIDCGAPCSTGRNLFRTGGTRTLQGLRANPIRDVGHSSDPFYMEAFLQDCHLSHMRSLTIFVDSQRDGDRYLIWCQRHQVHCELFIKPHCCSGPVLDLYMVMHSGHHRSHTCSMTPPSQPS